MPNIFQACDEPTGIAVGVGVGSLCDVVDYLAESMLHVTAYGVDNTGATDATAAIAATLGLGGFWYFPAGRYLIQGAGQGTDTGGVSFTLTKSLRVLCHPDAVFFAATSSPLDNDFIRFNAPVGGDGLPADKIEIFWQGGTFDQRAQCVSTSVPFISTYPPPAGLAGASNTCDALSFRMSYDVAGTLYAAARSIHVSDVTFISGAHWQTGGGDAGVFLGAGSGLATVSRCRFYGSRDLGVYASGIASGDQDLLVEHCRFDNCFGGISSKRGLSRFRYVNNDFRNCVVAMAASPLVAGSEYGVVTGNTISGCSVVFRFSQSDSNYFAGNQILSMGAYLADGVTAVYPYGLWGIWLAGAKNNIIRDITCPTVNAGQPGAIMVVMEDQNGDTGSSNIVERVWTTDFSRVVENKGTGTLNRVVNCYNFGTAGLREPLMITGDWVVRYATSGGDTYRNPLLFANGTAAAPIIARETQANTGMFFDTSEVAISTNGVERLDITTTQIAAALPIRLSNYTTAARDALASPQAGWVIFNTTTGALQTYNGSAWV